MTCILHFKCYDKDGRIVDAGQMHVPDSLDWLDIDVKAHYYVLRGYGHPQTKFALLESQGQQRLMADITLEHKNYKEIMEKKDGIEIEVERFIRDGGYSRSPRNQ